MSLTHLDDAGRARMVDVGSKAVSARVAVAEGRVAMTREAFDAVVSGVAKKGDVISTAELAGTMAAKRTDELIPLCHQVALDRVTVVVELLPELPGVRVEATARATARTGVEMEALVAVSIGCLTVFDMVKAVDRAMRIEGIRVLEKTGGARGDWHAAGLQDSFAEEEHT